MHICSNLGRVLATALLVLLMASPTTAQFRAGGEVVFDNERSAVGIPFELNSDKIYLHVKLNDSGPYWLVLDTGSPGMILDTGVAKELGISTGEKFPVGAAGENPFMLAPADSTFDASVPGMMLIDQPAHVGAIDVIVGPYEGRRIDGVLGGYNVFAKYIVEVDYAAQTIGVYERGHYTEREGGTTIPVEVFRGHCVIEATSVLADGDTLAGEFMLDTGLRGTMVFNTPFVDEHDLLNRFSPTIYTTVGGGLGGQVRAQVGRLQDFVIGGISLGGIHASLSQIIRGAFANPDRAGIIGSAVLQRFLVVFDYAGERLILYEQDYNAERLDFDKSGTFLVSDVDDLSVYRVIDVIKGSPAEEAGLQVGDVIREIDGKPAALLDLERLRRLFRRDAGTIFSIVYKRDDQLHTTKLTLRKVI
jgi:hypothetical protein